MRIIWFTPGFAVSENDTEAVPYLQSLALEIRKYADLHIIALEYPYTDKAYVWNGIPVYPCNGQNRRWTKLRTAFRVWNICRRLCQGQTNLVFHSFWLGWAAVLAERIARLLQRRVPATKLLHCCTSMGQDVLPANNRRLGQLGKSMQDRLIVISDVQNESLFQTAGFKSPHKISFGILTAEISDVFTVARTTDIIGVGSLNAIKNWDKWLEVVAAVAAKQPNIRAVLIGKGPLEGFLLKKAQETGIAALVTIRSDLSRPEVLAYMRHTKVLLHTADFEGQAYVLIEAAAQGCRIVSTPVGVALEMADCGNTVAELAKKVQHALRQPAPDQPVVTYTADDTAKAYIDVYKKHISL